MSVNEQPATWRLRTATGIPYKLKEGYPTGDFGEDTGSIQTMLIIEADQLENFMRECLSGGTFYGPFSFLKCKKVSFTPLEQGVPCDPFGLDSLAPVGTYAQFLEVTVSYETSEKNPDNQNPELLDISCTASGEYLLYKAGGTVTKSDDSALYHIDPSLREAAAMGGTIPGGDQQKKVNLDPELPLTKMVPALEWSIKLQRVLRSALPGCVAKARDKLGKVNSDTMSLLHDAPPETVLFMGFSFSTKFSWRDTEPIADVEIKMLEKILKQDDEWIGHNHFLVPSSGKFDRLKPRGRDSVYDKTTLNDLFNGWSRPR